MVGFQTKLKHGEQSRILRTIPALKEARFARLGGIHRNTFLNSPRLLDEELRLRARPTLRFAGQITGVEGYVESAAIGMLAGMFAAAGERGERLAPPPPTTALGALLAHITQGADAATFQPMNVNFGLFPPIDEAAVRGRDRKRVIARRALADLDVWLGRKAAAE
jgi:methylenetetrahydrofolate--tRNA-(uracil-5-)-methyltransferase